MVNTRLAAVGAFVLGGVLLFSVGLFLIGSRRMLFSDTFELYAEFSRLLSFGGRYVCITGCYNDVTGGRSKSVSRIDEHYTCNIHPRSEYFKAMAANGLVPINVLDLTAQTIPYWELRAKSSLATGIEEPFLTAYREGSFHYLLIAADRV